TGRGLAVEDGLARLDEEILLLVQAVADRDAVHLRDVDGRRGARAGRFAASTAAGEKRRGCDEQEDGCTGDRHGGWPFAGRAGWAPSVARVRTCAKGAGPPQSLAASPTDEEGGHR